MFTILGNKVYLIENKQIFPVNISIEKGVEKAEKGVGLPEVYDIYTFNEIKLKYQIKEGKPYVSFSTERPNDKGKDEKLKK